MSHIVSCVETAKLAFLTHIFVAVHLLPKDVSGSSCHLYLPTFSLQPFAQVDHALFASGEFAVGEPSLLQQIVSLLSQKFAELGNTP